MYWLWQFIMYMVSPFAFYVVFRKNYNAQKHQWLQTREFYGYYRKTFDVDLWIHGASIGEFKHFVSIYEKLTCRCVLTTQSSTGYALIQSFIKEQDQCVFAPIDRHHICQRFLKAFRPKAVILLESELWPGWLHLLKKHSIPVYVINGRINPRSFRRYQFLRHIWPAYSAIHAVCAQSESDRYRYQQLGAGNCKTLPNLKWSALPMTVSPADTFTVCAGSFHCQEVMALLEAWASTDLPQHICLIVAPRHMHYLDKIDHKMQQLGLKSLHNPNSPGVFIVKTIGQLMHYYQMSHVALLGGTFSPRGGQNPIEPATCALPIISGPHYTNFISPVDTLIQAGGCVMVQNILEAVSKCQYFYSHPKNAYEIGQLSLSAVKAHGDISQRYIDWIKQYIPQATR